jgi:hypothetical protein
MQQKAYKIARLCLTQVGFYYFCVQRKWIFFEPGLKCFMAAVLASHTCTTEYNWAKGNSNNKWDN